MNNIDILEKMKIVNGKIENVTPIDAIFAISNLIAENKELKEKIKEINEEYNAEQKHEMENTIPKSKVKAKIKQLDYNDISNYERRCKQEVLQELLGKE